MENYEKMQDKMLRSSLGRCEDDRQPICRHRVTFEFKPNLYEKIEGLKYNRGDITLTK